MLTERRVALLSQKIHTYLLLLYIFLFLVKTASILFSYSAGSVILNYALSALGWLIVLEMVWVIYSSVLSSITSGIFLIKPIVYAVIKVLVYIILAVLSGTISRIMVEGL